MSWQYDNDRKGMIRVTPQEKIRWFWSTGELPGTMFDEVDERKKKVSEQARSQQAKQLQPRSPKRPEETLELEESSVDLRRRS